MNDDLLEKMTRSDYIRWAAWAEALWIDSDTPYDVREKWKSLLSTPYTDLTDQERGCLRRLAKERLDLFLR